MSNSLTVARAHGSFCRLRKISRCDEHSARCPCDCGLPQGEAIPLCDASGLFVFNLGCECGPGWAMFFLFSSRSAVMLLLAFLLHLPLLMTYGTTPDLRHMWRAGNEDINVTINENSVLCTMSPTSTNRFLGRYEYGDVHIAYSERFTVWTISGNNFSAIANAERDSTLVNADWRLDPIDVVLTATRQLTRPYVPFYLLTAGNLGPDSFHGIWLMFPSHLTVIVVAIYVAVFLASRKTLKTRLVNARHSPSLYTVHVTKLPQGADEDEVKEYFDAILDDGSKNPPDKCVVKVLMLYRLGAVAPCFKQRAKLELELKMLDKTTEKYNRIQEFEQVHGIKANWINRFYRSTKIQTRHRVANALQKVNNEIQVWESTMHNAVCGAFVTFKLPMHAQQVLSAASGWETQHPNLKGTSLVCRIKASAKPRHLRVRKAPEPGDVNWANVGVKGRYIICRSIITYSIFGLLCFATFEIIKQLHIWREAGMDKGDYHETPLAHFLSIVQVVLITTMASVVCFVGRRERMKRKSHDEASVMIKVSILLVLNVGVSILLVETMLWNNVGVFGGFRGIIRRLENTQMPGVPWYLSSSVAHQILAYLTSSCFVTPLFIMLEPHFTLTRRIWRYLAFSVKAYRTSRTQKQLNKLWEPSHFLLFYRIAFVLHISVVAIWYMAIAPLALLLGACVLIFCYWVDKYVLLHRRRRPKYQDMHVALTAISLFQAALVVQPFFTVVLLIPTSSSSVIDALVALLLAAVVSLIVLCITTWSDEVGNYILQYLRQPNDYINSNDSLDDANTPFLIRKRRFQILSKILCLLYEQTSPQMCRYGVEIGMRRQKSFITCGIPLHAAQYSFADQYHKLSPVCAFLPDSINPTFLPEECAQDAVEQKTNKCDYVGAYTSQSPVGSQSIEMFTVGHLHSDSTTTTSNDSRVTDIE